MFVISTVKKLLVLFYLCQVENIISNSNAIFIELSRKPNEESKLSIETEHTIQMLSLKNKLTIFTYLLCLITLFPFLFQSR